MKVLWRMVISRNDVASCMQVLRSLDAYVDGEVHHPVAAKRIVAHLDWSRRCGMKA